MRRDPTTASHPVPPAGGRRSRSRGIALMEFALILPLLLIIVLATADLGMLSQTRLVLSNVCREGGSIASRAGTVGPALTDLLQASGRPLALGGPDGRIVITRIAAGRSSGAPAPRIVSQVAVGGLNVGSIVGGPTFGLSSSIYGHLVFKPENDAADISQVTIVEVYYKFRPITPISNFIPGMLTRDGGGLVLRSKSVF